MKQIKLKNNKHYKSFLGMDKPTAITRQWNQIKYKTGKKEVSLEELQYIMKKTTNVKVFTEVLEIYNTKARKENKAGADFKIYSKKERTKKAIREMAQANKVDKLTKNKKVIEDDLSETGFKPSHIPTDFYIVDINGLKVPNPALVGKKIEDIKEQAEKFYRMNPANDLSQLPTLLNELETEHKEYLKDVKAYNKTKVEEINNKISERVQNFVLGGNITKNGLKHKGYFANISASAFEEKVKLKALLERLNPQELLQVEDLLLDRDFLQLWDSNQDSPHFKTRAFSDNRLRELVRVLENHIGEGVELKGGIPTFYKLKNEHVITTGIRLGM